MNNPYIDDGLFHWGFYIGGSFMSFATDKAPANVSSPGIGFRVGLIGELRLCRYLSLRCSPGMEFSYRWLTYKDLSPSKTLVGAIPIQIPLYLKFAAERMGNMRPYVIAGGGVSVNINSYDPVKEDIGLKLFDAFCEAGFGCDLYILWFKFCPEITYRIGFVDQLDRDFKPSSSRGTVYLDQLKPHRLINQAICLTFNFQD